MKEAPITADRHVKVLKMLAQGPMNGADIARALNCNSSIASNLLGRMMRNREICRKRIDAQRWRYCLGDTFIEAAPEPKPEAPKRNIYAVEVPRFPGSPEGQTMRVSLPAMPWGAA